MIGAASVRLRTLLPRRPNPSLIHAAANRSDGAAEIASPISDSPSPVSGSVEWTDELVERFILDLSHPSDARKALSFFQNTDPSSALRGPRCHCLGIHVLVRAGLLKQARTLLESLIEKNPEGDSIAELLLSTYASSSSSSARAFDLLVQSYAKSRMFDAAFDACVRVTKQGLSLGLSSYNSLISFAEKSGQSAQLWRVYEFMIANRVYPNEATIETAVNLMCKEGSLSKHIRILDTIHGSRCSAWAVVNTALVLRVFREERFEDGFALLKKMLIKNVIPTDVAYSLTIYGYCEMGRIESARETYEELLKRGYPSNAFLYTLFIGLECKDGNIDEAVRLLKEMKTAKFKPYNETYNVLIETCSKIGKLESCLSFYEEMIRNGFLPSRSACNAMIEKLCEAGEAERADDALTVLIDKGFIPDEWAYAHLIVGFAKNGSIEKSLRVYHEMGFRGVSVGEVVYDALIGSLCGCGRLEEAEKYLAVMKERSVSVSARVYEALIVAHCGESGLQRAHQLHEEMVKKALKPCDLVLKKLGVA
ncbi:hypothetical protein QJS04_geneDACA008910 [Acorus gramineus]|uniref:Pentatricopeptide repeat-containing protein-mitochondrial domain-containing protein n=1 Tax=Acorus gramineus TaxID=55184 RepID=A0AAV9ADQ3_ACOGR|nr:hypothetical protein QJS04_geneDACA008910 [Acorus gramineus]